MGRMPSVLTAIGLVFILVGGLRGGDPTSGAFAFMALLILGVTTYPPADARRGAQAALVLATALGLLVLGLLLEDARAGALKAQVTDDLLMLVGCAMVVAEAAGRLLGGRNQDRIVAPWGGGADGAHPAPSSLTGADRLPW